MLMMVKSLYFLADWAFFPHPKKSPASLPPLLFPQQRMLPRSVFLYLYVSLLLFSFITSSLPSFLSCTLAQTSFFHPCKPTWNDRLPACCVLWKIKCNDRLQIMILFDILSLWNDRRCQSPFIKTDINSNAHTHTQFRPAQCPRRNMIGFFVCFPCWGNIMSLREIKESSGLLTVPPRHLLNLPFLPRRRVN